MDIPHSIAPRRDTGLYNGKLGIWLFLASEVMGFGALFGSYISLRAGSLNWLYGAAKDLSVPVGAFNTMILITSSITMALAWGSLRLRDFSRYKLHLGLTILLGTTFLIVKAFEYAAKFDHGHTPASHPFFAIYFALTGLHALHVLGGLLVNAYHWGPGSKLWLTDPARLTNRLEVSGLFWHFVGLIWVLLFPVFYLL